MCIVLASASPRRRDLLNFFGLSFECVVPDVSEVTFGDPTLVAITNARLKAEKAWQEHQDKLVIGADTVVVHNEEILGKPHNQDEAYQMLRTLSRGNHQVITGVAIASKQAGTLTFHETTTVRFRELTEQEIWGYISTDEPMDKAGSYGIQGFGGLFVEGIHGCYYNVVGLPIPRLALHLREYGVWVLPTGRSEEDH